MVSVNAAAFVTSLLESELFGHEAGAFSGARGLKRGVFELAHGGTLFLDEIGEMHFDLQSKLLRFLQTGTFRPVGGSRDEKADLRVVCATNRDPLAEVAAGRFREDLYYRLHVVPIHLPPLREREDDVVLIANELVRQFAGEEGKSFRALAEDAAEALRHYKWPGNVRQLQNVLRNAIVMHAGEAVTAAMLSLPRAPGFAAPSPVQFTPAQSRPACPARGANAAPGDPAQWKIVDDIVALADLEFVAIDRAVALCEGNVPRAAAFLGVSPSTLYRKKQSR